jgi:hypothetical protein
MNTPGPLEVFIGLVFATAMLLYGLSMGEE